jgi:phosphoenolpyruvate synthase/pyruvate phosphate dikinase
VAANLVVRLSGRTEDGLGGKASRLQCLYRLGFPVPDGWVVPLDTGRALRAGTLPDSEFDNTIGVALREFGPGALFAVRSSADGEDSARASFAGQFRTELGVRADAVPSAVREVLRSVDGPGAAGYARRLGVAPPGAMAVLIQPQLAPVLSGVCLTVHPVTGRPAMVLDYAHGLGDGVAGGAAPDGTLILPRLADGTVLLDGLAGLDRVPAEGLSAVVALAAEVERHSAGPQDVEWAVDERGPWLLQARPVTTVVGTRTDPCSP